MNFLKKKNLKSSLPFFLEVRLSPEIWPTQMPESSHSNRAPRGMGACALHSRRQWQARRQPWGMSTLHSWVQWLTRNSLWCKKLSQNNSSTHKIGLLLVFTSHVPQNTRQVFFLLLFTSFYCRRGFRPLSWLHDGLQFYTAGYWAGSAKYIIQV